MRVHILPFRAPKDLAHTASAIAHRFGHHLEEIRQKKLARIERLLEGLKSVGEMTPEAAQELGSRLDLSRLCAAPRAHFRRPSVRRRPGFSSPMLTAGGGDYESR
ncbi:hypothetical protein, partial [Paracoccus hibiscisoli]